MNVTTNVGSGEARGVNRDVVIQVRLTEDEHTAWLAAAEAANLKLSEFIRRRVNGTMTIAPPEPPRPVGVVRMRTPRRR